jgi:hypothetical protein
MIAAAMLLSSMSVLAQDVGNAPMSCDNVKLKPEAVQHFAALKDSCEAVVERDGAMFAKTTAIIRSTGVRKVTLYLPATDHTFTVKPGSATWALIEGRKYRLTELARGQEIHIYVPIDETA